MPNAMTLTALANLVIGKQSEIQEPEAIGKIMLITGYPFERSIKGYKMMLEIPEFKAAIQPQTIGITERLIANNPNLQTLFENFDLVPGAITFQKFTGWKKPVPFRQNFKTELPEWN